MSKKYTSALTAGLTPDNWKDKLNLKDMSLEEVIDVFGDAKEMEKFGKKLAGYLREIIDSRMPEGEDEYFSDNWQIGRKESERTGLDSDKIKEDMSEAWIEEHSSTTEFVTLRCTRLKE